MSEFIFTLSVFVIFISVMLVVYNNHAVVKQYKITTDKIEGDLTIVVIADLHNKKYNSSNTYIIDKVKSCNPDIIIIAGDLVDSLRSDFAIAKQTLDELKKISDVYYVSGNHENYLGVDKVIDALDCKDVFLDDEYKIFKQYSILGISDSDNYLDNKRENALRVFEQLDNFKIAVCHRPYEFENGLKLCKYDVDLVISAHEHGGVVRIPFFGAIATHDGLFPKYSKGIYNENGRTMVISGGLGNTVLPLRINNFPEIVKIEIKEK